MTSTKKNAAAICRALSKAAPAISKQLLSLPANVVLDSVRDLFGGRRLSCSDIQELVLKRGLTQEQKLKLEIRMHELSLQQLESENKRLQLCFDSQQEARAKQVKLKDFVPGAIAITILSGYFSMVACFLLFPTPGNREFITAMLNDVLGPCLLYAVGYYYGCLSFNGVGIKSRNIFCKVFDIIRGRRGE